MRVSPGTIYRTLFIQTCGCLRRPRFCGRASRRSDCARSAQHSEHGAHRSRNHRGGATGAPVATAHATGGCCTYGGSGGRVQPVWGRHVLPSHVSRRSHPQEQLAANPSGHPAVHGGHGGNGDADRRGYRPSRHGGRSAEPERTAGHRRIGPGARNARGGAGRRCGRCGWPGCGPLGGKCSLVVAPRCGGALTGSEWIGHWHRSWRSWGESGGPAVEPLEAGRLIRRTRSSVSHLDGSVSTWTRQWGRRI